MTSTPIQVSPLQSLLNTPPAMEHAFDCLIRTINCLISKKVPDGMHV